MTQWAPPSVLSPDDLDKIAKMVQATKFKMPPVGRNDPCPCGSGMKFKKCCINKFKGSV